MKRLTCSWELVWRFHVGKFEFQKELWKNLESGKFSMNLSISSYNFRTLYWALLEPLQHETFQILDFATHNCGTNIRGH